MVGPHLVGRPLGTPEPNPEDRGPTRLGRGVRPAAALMVLLSCALAAAGCGSPQPDADDARGVEPTLRERYDAPGDDVAVIAGTSDYAPGRNRFSFLVADGEGELVSTPTANVWVARGLDERPFARVTARLEDVGVPGGAEADAAAIYVAHVRLPEPGTYWYLAEPVGAAEPVQALGNLVAAEHTAAPAVGERAVASDTPTLADVGGDVSRISTAKPPDPELLRVSVADALAAGRPFVVTFATPQFCESRTCAPVVQVVQAVERRLRSSGVRFVHVEIYDGLDPAGGQNRWVREWKLPTEPFTFVVGGDGRIAARFEGAVSARELEAAVRRVVPGD